jgi:hypothetical protein
VGVTFVMAVNLALPRKKRLQTRRVLGSRYRIGNWECPRVTHSYESLRVIHSLLDIVERDILPLNCGAIGYGPNNKVLKLGPSST